ALLPCELRTLLEEAREMKWPFVPEKWQYKQDVGPEDKTNLQDVIGARLPELLIYLKASIMVKDCVTAAAIVFLIDRFLYWMDASGRLLQVAKGLHRLRPATPLAPQVLIRQARLSVNAGKLLKAEYILSSLINDNGATGTWRYAKESDRTLVQSVCLQIRGQILQKLGMWYEAAELIWASVVGYFKLPQPDKKGIATSLGILANIFASMNENDYVRFKTSAEIDLHLLGEFSHRLLSAAEACKLAAAYSQYTPLFVLTAVNIRGTCLLSYSHSRDCPPERRTFYLCEAKESFEIGLLTKNESSPVTSKQELHSFVKAAFCLTTVHRWLYGESEELRGVSLLCKEAVGRLDVYSTSEDGDKGALAKEIMALIASVKRGLQVRNFPNSDARSYVPDSYKGAVENLTLRGEANFEKILAMHSQHHRSVCDVFENTCRIRKITSGEAQVGACITTLKTETKSADTMCTTEETTGKGRDTAKRHPASETRSTSEGCGGHARNKHIGSDVRKNSFKETEPVERVKSEENGACSRWGGESGTATSESSWCRLSKSSCSSSWEELGCSSSSRGPPRAGSWEPGPAVEPGCPTGAVAGAAVGGPRAPPPRQSCAGPARCAGPAHGALTGRPAESSWAGGEQQSPGGAVGCSHGQASSEGSNFSFLSSPSSSTSSTSSASASSSSASLSFLSSSASFSSSPTSPSSSSSTSSASTSSFSLSFSSSSFFSSSSCPSSSSSSASTSCSSCSGAPEVDPQAETENDSDLPSAGNFTYPHPAKNTPERQLATSAPATPASAARTSVTDRLNCATTEEEEEKPQSAVSRAASHLSARCSPAQLPESSPGWAQPCPSPRQGGLGFVPGSTKGEVPIARLLRDDDYCRLLSGVEHGWLVRRLLPTGTLKAKPLQKAHSALLLKYSKKSGLWTGQETAVFIGDYLNVAKEGKQRRAFWIHFLHQEESLGRYVGKEYKEEKGLLHHFSDVERQMTAQYYVTEFNKRLYEQKIPTQIFYIPSAVLLILEDRTITGCMSVEPYMLGEFVKLSNNTKVVKNEYEATRYGLAYGHFCYEFSKGTDVVVDLQGWVTGNGKGLIYLTDPQIHSLNRKDVSHANFGKRGIYYFFNNQHVECNEICHRLSLTRPIIE
ncbi:ALPK1 kinase, partial [Eudromia elegans]|nr:ALPK1 kinase [Eudromia elegans]